MEPCGPCAQPDHCVAKGECFGDKTRSITFGSVPGGDRPRNRPHHPTKTSEVPWTHKQVAREYRGTDEKGRPTYMPYLSAETHKPINVKRFNENKPHFEQTRRALRNDPNVFRKD